MSHITICGLSGSKYFPTSSHKRTIFEKKVPERKMSVLILSTTFVQNASHSKNWARYGKQLILVFVYTAHYSCQIWMKLGIFLDRFTKYIRISNFMKIVPVGDEVLQAGGWADMTKLTVSFRNFSKVPKKLNVTGQSPQCPLILSLITGCIWRLLLILTIQETSLPTSNTIRHNQERLFP